MRHPCSSNNLTSTPLSILVISPVVLDFSLKCFHTSKRLFKHKVEGENMDFSLYLLNHLAYEINVLIKLVYNECSTVLDFIIFF